MNDENSIGEELTHYVGSRWYRAPELLMSSTKSPTDQFRTREMAQGPIKGIGPWTRLSIPCPRETSSTTLWSPWGSVRYPMLSICTSIKETLTTAWAFCLTGHRASTMVGHSLWFQLTDLSQSRKTHRPKCIRRTTRSDKPRTHRTCGRTQLKMLGSDKIKQIIQTWKLKHKIWTRQSNLQTTSTQAWHVETSLSQE